MNLALELALMGMGMVFAFLILLVIATTLMSWLVNRLEDSFSAVNVAETGTAVSAGKLANRAASSSDIPPGLLTAIASAAIHKYRSRIRK